MPNSMNLSEWLTIWLRDYIGNVKPATVKSYTDHTKLNIIPYLGNTQFSRLSPAMIQPVYNKLQRERGLSAKSINNVHGVLHRALNQAQKLGYIRRNPLDAVTLPRIENTQIKPLEDNELVHLLKAIKGNPYEFVFFVTVFTGLRQCEILGLTWDCVNFAQNTLYINKHHGKVKDGKEYVFSSLKYDRPRMIMAAEGVMDVLKMQQARQQQWAALAGNSWNNADNLFFTTELGRYLCNQTVYLAFKIVVKLWGWNTCVSMTSAIRSLSTV